MIEKQQLKHSVELKEVANLAHSEEHGSTSLIIGDRAMYIEPIKTDPVGADDQAEITHLITTIRTVKTKDGVDRRYKELSLTSKGIVMLALLLGRYVTLNDMVSEEDIQVKDETN